MTSIETCLACGAMFRMYEAEYYGTKCLEGQCPNCNKWMTFSLAESRKKDVITVLVKGYTLTIMDEGRTATRFFPLAQSEDMERYIKACTAFGELVEIAPVPADGQPEYTADDVADGLVEFVEAIA